LLIGNANYSEKVGPLRSPYNDIALVKSALERLGFEVTVLRDANFRSMNVEVPRFIGQVRDAGPNAISFFYYSGHGVAKPGSDVNYLVPVDAPDPDGDAFWSLSYELRNITNKLSSEAPMAAHFVVFDACRNELNLKVTGKKSLGTVKGFVPVIDSPGLLIAYSTAPNQTASDIGSDYAKALAEEIIKPDQEAVTMFRNVQLKVKHVNGQDPWLNFPSIRAVYFAGKTRGK